MAKPRDGSGSRNAAASVLVSVLDGDEVCMGRELTEARARSQVRKKNGKRRSDELK